MRAFSADLVVLETMIGTNDSLPNHKLTMVMSPEEAMPQIVYEHTDFGVPLEAVATKDLWAVTFGRYDILWHAPEPANEMLVAWQSPDNRLAYSLGAAGRTVFFSTERTISYDGGIAFEHASRLFSAPSRNLLLGDAQPPAAIADVVCELIGALTAEGRGFRDPAELRLGA